MSENLNLLGLDQATIDNAGAQEVKPAFEPLKSGLYNAKVTEFATFMTDKGARMLKAVFKIEGEDRDITVYQNITKKDGKPNDIGQATFNHIMQAINRTISDVAVKQEKIKAYGKEVDGVVIKGIDDIPLKVGVRQVFTEGDKYEDSNEIDTFLRADGTNAKGENLVDTFNEKIEKNPIIKRVSKNNKSASATSATKTASGQSVDDML